jgi:hypothetical protein
LNISIKFPTKQFTKKIIFSTSRFFLITNDNTICTEIEKKEHNPNTIELLNNALAITQIISRFLKIKGKKTYSYNQEFTSSLKN